MTACKKSSTHQDTAKLELLKSQHFLEIWISKILGVNVEESQLVQGSEKQLHHQSGQGVKGRSREGRTLGDGRSCCGVLCGSGKDLGHIGDKVWDVYSGCCRGTELGCLARHCNEPEMEMVCRSLTCTTFKHTAFNRLK